jgi:hypothetical protein
VAERFRIDLKQLVQVCLNDPDAEDMIRAALAEGPAPVRTPVATFEAGDKTWQVVLRTDREREPGESGFLPREADGDLAGPLKELVTSGPEASTMSPQQMAAQLGITVEELLARNKPPT